MINLMPLTAKQEIRAARRNVILSRYIVHILIITLLTNGIFGLGFWLTAQEIYTTQRRIDEQNAQAKDFAKAQQQAKEFRTNLAVAQKVLDKGIPYSVFLTTLAKDKPDDTIITAIHLANATSAPAAASKQDAFELEARTISPNKAIELKTALEKSVLFENVSLVNVDTPAAKTDNQPYPVLVRLRMKLSTVTLEEEKKP